MAPVRQHYPPSQPRQSAPDIGPYCYTLQWQDQPVLYFHPARSPVERYLPPQGLGTLFRLSQFRCSLFPPLQARFLLARSNSTSAFDVPCKLDRLPTFPIMCRRHPSHPLLAPSALDRHVVSELRLRLTLNTKKPTKSFQVVLFLDMNSYEHRRMQNNRKQRLQAQPFVRPDT